MKDDAAPPMTTAEKLKQLMEGASASPWKIQSFPDDPKDWVRSVDGGVLADCGAEHTYHGEAHGEANARLIVASVNLLPALAAVVEAATKIAKYVGGGQGPGVIVTAGECRTLWSALSALDAAVAREVG